MSSLRRWRPALVRVHRVVGWLLSLAVAVLGLTGALLAFYPELDLALHPQWRTPEGQAGAAPASADVLWQSLQAAHPQRPGPWRIEWPLEAGWPVQARYMKPIETQGQAFAPLVVTQSPVTGEVLGGRLWGQYLVTWLYDLHYSLLLDRAGRTGVAVIGLASMVLMLVGLALWWPSRQRRAQAFRIRWRGSAQQWVYDLHAVVGVCVLPVWLLVAGTGVMLAEPDWFRPTMQRVSPISHAPHVSEPGFQVSQVAVTAEQAIARARQRFPDAELRWLETPGAGRPVWRVQMWQAFEPGRRFPKTQVWVDARSGAVLAVQDPATRSASDAVLAWLHPLHDGEFLGLAGRVAVLLAGVLWVLSVATGLVRWWHKRRASARARP